MGQHRPVADHEDIIRVVLDRGQPRRVPGKAEVRKDGGPRRIDLARAIHAGFGGQPFDTRFRVQPEHTGRVLANRNEQGSVWTGSDAIVASV